jgi:hypothetical protein
VCALDDVLIEPVGGLEGCLLLLLLLLLRELCHPLGLELGNASSEGIVFRRKYRGIRSLVGHGRILSMRFMAVRSGWGQDDRGPTGVADHAMARIRSAVSPFPFIQSSMAFTFAMWF